ncbi:hypothetical protein MLD38_029281 [Melastoma candidum]|uniref:Uncharacterized protein n=1 Tax=Melastoma candidum TaxID=119954 RepID=A0ACB9N451_9MYRT|nr:hypothetical protein MLD38_029281 [Melastoma candidum]
MPVAGSLLSTWRVISLKPLRTQNVLLLLSLLFIAYLPTRPRPSLHPPPELPPSVQRLHRSHQPPPPPLLLRLLLPFPHPPRPLPPPLDSSRFPYTFPCGLLSAVRLARIIKEVVKRSEPGARWYVFGDDDTVFFVDNLLPVMDGCLVRYAHLYGGDARLFSCVAELGIGLIHEPGFHQTDMRGDLFGLLTAHPMSLLVSLHHMEAVDTIFPKMNKTEAMEHLFKAVNVDPARILQQNMCYNRVNSLTISVSWGYAIQVYEGNILLPDLLSVQESFSPWRSRSVHSHYVFNMRDLPRDPCDRPVVFFLDNIISEEKGAQSDYLRQIPGNCVRGNIMRNLKRIACSHGDLNKPLWRHLAASAVMSCLLLMGP